MYEPGVEVDGIMTIGRDVIVTTGTGQDLVTATVLVEFDAGVD